MSQGRRKWDGIDLMRLMTEWDTKKWNAFLTRCDNNDDVTALQKTRYGLQIGMDDLAKNKMNSDEIIELYLRMIRSIENTAKRIFRRKYPNPCDNPILAAEYSKFLESKRDRDHELEKYFKKSGF